jgi:hypothetical protein
MDSIELEWQYVRKKYKFLEDLKIIEGCKEANGEIEIIDPSGIVWRKFKVRIIIPKKYPILPPIIFEIDNVIPRIPEWHINDDGSCCVGTNTGIYRKLENNISIIGWLDNIVMPYFFDQVYKLENEEYKGKEYSHGSYGLIEDYKDWWSLKSDADVVSKLKLITNWIKQPRNNKCFCGSNLKYKKCHFIFKEFDGIPIEIYKSDLKIILSESRKND